MISCCTLPVPYDSLLRIYEVLLWQLPAAPGDLCDFILVFCLPVLLSIASRLSLSSLFLMQQVEVSL